MESPRISDKLCETEYPPNSPQLLTLQRPIQLRDLELLSQSNKTKPSGGFSSREEILAADELKPLRSWLERFRNKRRQKKAATRGRRGDKKSKIGRGTTTTPFRTTFPYTPLEEFSTPFQQPPSNNPHLRASKTSQQVFSRTPTSHPKPNKRSIPHHHPKLTSPSILRKSTHLERTKSNNYRPTDQPPSPATFPVRGPHSSQVTVFSDFISGKAYDVQSAPSPNPAHTARSLEHFQEPYISPRQPYRGSGWTFMQPEEGPDGGFLGKGSGSQSQSQSLDPEIQHTECSICGVPNSPCTQYGEQGLWLCTACRNPFAAVELPPRTSSHGRISSSKPLSQYNNTPHNDNEPWTCEYCCAAFVPPDGGDHIFCSRECRRLSAVDQLAMMGSPILLPYTYQPQAHGSANTQHPAPIPPRPSSRSPYKTPHRTPSSPPTLSPTPPLKDSIYLSSPSPNPKSKPQHQPPLPPKPKSYRTVPAPISTSPSSLHPRPRRTSSIYPPTPHHTFSTFGYPPVPPMPTTPVLRKLQRGRKGGGAYTDSVYRVGDVDADEMWKVEESPTRDTRFYAYWETILTDDEGRSYREV